MADLTRFTAVLGPKDSGYTVQFVNTPEKADVIPEKQSSCLLPGSSSKTERFAI